MFASNIFALMSALCIATGSMFIGELNGRLPLLQLGRWQLSAAFISTAIISLILGGWHSLGLWQFQLLAASGLFGIALASTTYYATIYTVGPRLTALLFSLTSPFALALGYFVLGESITVQQGLASCSFWPALSWRWMCLGRHCAGVVACRGPIPARF